MKALKFKKYDSGLVRTYFNHGKILYCIHLGDHYLPELMLCTDEGEPLSAIDDCINYKFINMPPDGDTWSWIDILAYFQCQDIASNDHLIYVMNKLFEVET